MTLSVRIPKRLPEFPLLDFIDKDRREANTVPAPSEIKKRQDYLDRAFPGPAYEAEFDEARLTGLQHAIFNLMRDGKRRTIPEMKAELKRGSENGIAALLRNLRSSKKGKHKVEKYRVGDPKLGIWTYELIPNQKALRAMK